jgi:hypothetical protein
MEVGFSFVGFHYHPQIHNVVTKRTRKLIVDNSKITYQGHKGFPLEHMHMLNSFDSIEVIHEVDQTWEQNHGFDQI